MITTGPAHITNWWEAVAWTLIGFALVMGAGAGLFGAYHARRNGAVTDAVREQVENTHDSNLRDDLDRHERKLDSVDTKVDELAGCVKALSRQMESAVRELRSQAARQGAIAAKYHPEESGR